MSNPIIYTWLKENSEQIENYSEKVTKGSKHQFLREATESHLRHLFGLTLDKAEHEIDNFIERTNEDKQKAKEEIRILAIRFYALHDLFTSEDRCFGTAECEAYYLEIPQRLAGFGINIESIQHPISLPDEQSEYLPVILVCSHWDCECDSNYIHSKSVPACPECFTNQDDQPDSRLNEVCDYEKGE